MCTALVFKAKIQFQSNFSSWAHPSLAYSVDAQLASHLSRYVAPPTMKCLLCLWSVPRTLLGPVGRLSRKATKKDSESVLLKDWCAHQLSKSIRGYEYSHLSSKGFPHYLTSLKNTRPRHTMPTPSFHSHYSYPSGNLARQPVELTDAGLIAG